jgi:hypothetical protein
MVNRIGRKTSPGFADPRVAAMLPSAHDSERPRATPQARASTAPGPRKQTPLVEVEVSYDRGATPRTEQTRRVFEVWTNNHVYALDSRMNCIEVRQVAGGKAVPDHPFLGTRLVGGQAQDEQSVEMSYPFPRPGAFAVFESKRGNRKQFSRTSAVTRVVLRMRIVRITESTAVPTWEDVSGEP